LKFYKHIIYFLFLIPFCAKGQKVYSSDQLLNNNLFRKASNKVLDYLNEANTKLPLFNKLEFRSETTEFDFEQQEYILRASFNNRKLRNNQKLQIKNYKEIINAKDLILREQEAFEKYFNVAKWYYAAQKTKLLKDLEILLLDQKKILQKQIANGLSFPIEEILKIENNIQTDQRELFNLDFVKATAQDVLFKEVPAHQISLEQDNWISLEKAHLKIIDLEKLSIKNSSFLLNELKMEEKKIEFKMEQDKSKDLLDFIQVKYRGKNRLSFAKEWSVGFGINLPYQGRNRTKQNESFLNVLEAEQKSTFIKKEFEKQLNLKIQNFKLLYKTYKNAISYGDKFDLEKTLEKLVKLPDMDPIKILKIKESIIKNKILVLKIEEKACLVYLGILSDLGHLVQFPETNFVSQNIK